ncbi:MAG: hypothetical protein NZM31_10540 [Gemmatales bacterium]|nr:hypothetical protein [Gemmatales bacterium]MDW8387434.1 hypothetical protein [Gemmatales bacterium]
MTTAVVILAIAVGLAVVAVVVKVILGFLKANGESRIQETYRSDEILLQNLMANSFGLESLGLSQVRGNGALVLTRQGLHFFQYVPKREVRIPLTAIMAVSLTKSHLGKVTVYDLLKVEFLADGQKDSIAWYVANAAEWKRQIEELRQTSSASSAGL